MARASSGAGRSGDPRMSSTRILLPAPFMRAIVRRASRWREAKPSISLCSAGARRAARTRRPLDRPRAESHHGLAQVVVFDR